MCSILYYWDDELIMVAMSLDAFYHLHVSYLERGKIHEYSELGRCEMQTLMVKKVSSKYEQCHRTVDSLAKNCKPVSTIGQKLFK